MKELLITQSWRLINSFIKFFIYFVARTMALKLLKKNSDNILSLLQPFFKNSGKYYVHTLVI